MWSVSSTWKNALYMLLLLLSRFSRVRLCATPEMAAHRAPLSLGFSRQEHWSVLPFPSPVHEIEKWKWSRSVVFNSSQPHGLQPTRLLCPWDFPGKSTGAGCHRLLRLIHSRCLITINISYVVSSSSYYFKLSPHTHTNIHTYTHTVPPPVDFGSSLLLFHFFSFQTQCKM